MDQRRRNRLERGPASFSYDLLNAAHPTISHFQARYGLSVSVLAVLVHAEISMKAERLPVHLVCAWGFRPIREVSARRAPPLLLRGKERESFPTRAVCDSKTDGMQDLDSSAISWSSGDDLKPESHAIPVFTRVILDAS